MYNYAYCKARSDKIWDKRVGKFSYLNNQTKFSPHSMSVPVYYGGQPLRMTGWANWKPGWANDFFFGASRRILSNKCLPTLAWNPAGVPVQHSLQSVCNSLRRRFRLSEELRRKSEVNLRSFWVYISPTWGQNPWADWPLFFMVVDIRDVITCFKFGDNRFRGLASAVVSNLAISNWLWRSSLQRSHYHVFVLCMLFVVCRAKQESRLP